MTCTFRIVLLTVVLFSACQNPAPPPGAETGAEAYMQAFEGRGDLADDSEPLPPQEALRRFQLPDDVSIELVASEPLVQQPVELNFDHQGRLWVVQYKQYPYPAGLKVTDVDWHLRLQFDRVPEPPPADVRGADTISFLEDTDGDGVFDHAVDAITGLNIATSVTWGRGRIWVLNPPYLLAFPDPDGDGMPDGDPEVHLSGFGLEDTHAVANSLRWGPDGWLYGAQGSTTTATIQAKNSDPVHFKGQAIWRYHPEREVFELFAEGGGNTFHVEFDDKGRLYSGHNGGEARGQYYKQGGYYVKNWGKHGALTNPFALGYFGHMQHEGENLRFTHAFIRYGGNSLPPRYQDALIGINPLHNFVQVSRFDAEGSSFKTVDTERLVTTEDHWFRPVDIKEGPDGAVYMADWYDSRLTHVDPRDTWHKTSGRIYRIRGKASPEPAAIDFSRLSTDELVQSLQHSNRWHRQQALRQFGDRKDAGAIPKLTRFLFDEAGQTSLEALWALNLSGGLDDEMALRAVEHEDPFVRMWAIRLLGDTGSLNSVRVEQLKRLAQKEEHPEVRSQLAASIKRWRDPAALSILRPLLLRADDASDPHIPLQLWWALEAHVGHHPDAVVAMFDEEVWASGLVRNFILHRVMERVVQSGLPEVAARLLERAPSEAEIRPLIEGFRAGTRGASLSDLPEALAALYQKNVEALGQPAYALGLRRGDEVAVSQALSAIADTDVADYDRLVYIEILGEAPNPEAVPVLLSLMKTDASQAIRHAALRALQSYPNEEIGEEVLGAYPDRLRDDPKLREAALELLVSRADWAGRLVEAIEITRRIDRSDIPFQISQQMSYLGDSALTGAARRVWPALEPGSPEDKRAKVEAMKRLLRAAPGDAGRGKTVYQEQCGACHRLFEEGGTIGPDLTGYERSNLDAMLVNIIDPSAEVREGYVYYTVTTREGNSRSGILAGRRGNTIELKSFSGEVAVLVESDIVSMTPQPASLMPEGLLDVLSEEQIRDLFAYFMQ